MLKQKLFSTYSRLLTVARQYWLLFVIGIVGTLLISLADGALVWLIKPLMNKGIISRDTIFILWLPLFVLVLILVRALAGFCSSYFIARVARSVVMDMRQMLFAKYLHLPVDYFNNNNSGFMLSTVIYNVEQVANASSTALGTVVRDGSYILVALGIMFALSWQLSLFFIVVVPLVAWVIKKCSVRMRFLSKQVQKTMGYVTKVLDEGIRAHKVIKIYGGQRREHHKFCKATLTNRHQELKIAVTDSVSSGLVQLLVGIPLIAALYFATQPALGVTAGSFAAIITAMITLSRPLRRITNINSSIQKGIAGAESIFAVLDQPEEKDEGSHTVGRACGTVEFNNVSFTYSSGSEAVLNQINFKLEAGKTLALVGKSGAGKSTLASLLTRFYDTYDGAILLDNVDITHYKLANLRAQFALVSQDVILFDDTVANNIAYGLSGQEVSRETIEMAAEAACVTEFTDLLPNGLDTLVGEDGVLLSGGQKQRLAIARAFIKKAPVLILDEATSSLDTHSEKQIQIALKRLMQNCTTLVIAHRLSTVENADHILVLDKGSVIEQGTHTSLLTQQGTYADLYNLQFSPLAETV